jgi:hypothetical protein
VTLSEYFEKNGLEGLQMLAKQANTTVGYLYQLIYCCDKRRPSNSMTERLVEASGHALTRFGLENPKRMLVGRKGRSGRRRELNQSQR